MTLTWSAGNLAFHRLPVAALMDKELVGYGLTGWHAQEVRRRFLIAVIEDGEFTVARTARTLVYSAPLTYLDIFQ